MSGDAGNNSRTATESRERQNFEVSETRRERIIAPGQVRRISVAVMVDGVAATDPQGAATWEPRAEVSLPFKLAFFVIADGWSLLAGALVRSYNP